jgi:mono/diheme cytochrome c family protein
LTEVPEHLLQRSKARRAALGLGGDEGDVAAASTPSAAGAVEKAASAAPAAAAAATPAPVVETPPEPEVLPPFVEVAKARRKIPFWAASVLAILPVWALIYGLTLDKPTPKEAGPLALGATTYGACAGCHGASGGGGAGPALNGGKVVEEFPNIADHLHWVMEGTAGFQALCIPTYCASKKAVGSLGNMPGWKDTLDAKQLISVVRHEREAFGGGPFDPAEYDEVQKMVDENYPDRSSEFQAAIDEWKNLPSDA